MISVIWNRASVKAGMISDCQPLFVRKQVDHQPSCTTSPRPQLGSQRSMTPKNRTMSMPTRKLGGDIPQNDSCMKELKRNTSTTHRVTDTTGCPRHRTKIT